MKSNLRSGSIQRPAYTLAICLGLLTFMVSGPFILPFHTKPIASFWSEWWAAGLGLAAGAIGLIAPRIRLGSETKPLLFPPTLSIPAILLAAVLLQLLLGRLEFPQFGKLYAMYFLWAGLLLVLGRELADTMGLARLVVVLAIGIALGTVLSATAALAQWLGMGNSLPWLIFPNPVGPISSNIGHPNHHAHYSWLGLASVFYLRAKAHVSRAPFWLVILLLSFGSVVSGSRSVFLYLIVFLAMLAWTHHRDPQEHTKCVITDAAILLPVLVALNFFSIWASQRVPEVWVWLGSTLPSLHIGSTPIAAGGSSASIASVYHLATVPSDRVAEMRTTLSIFLEHPWLGQGVGNFHWATFMVTAGHPSDEYLIVVEHAHNFVFHIFAEFGAPVGILVVMGIGQWAIQFFRQPWKLEHFWCGTILGIGAVHSVLEYPLWYSYFLGPTALLLGATDRGKAFALPGRRITLYLACTVVAGALILGSLRADYAKLETASLTPLSGSTDRELAWRNSMNDLLKLYKESLLSPWVLEAFTNLAEPSRNLAQEHADLCISGIHVAPAPTLVARCATQLAIAGHGAEARQLTLNVLRAFPKQRSEIIDELEMWATKFPEAKPLWLLAQPN